MPINVQLVAVEHEVWSGEADMVIARTTEGELGILPGHAPLLGQLADDMGVVQIHRSGQAPLVVAVHGGFLSVTKEGVSILAEEADMVEDIDATAARSQFDEAQRALDSADSDDNEAERTAMARASSRLAATERASS